MTYDMVYDETTGEMVSRIQQSASDPCLYYLMDGDLMVIISTHVDDYVIGSSSDQWYQDFVAAFGAAFEITDMGVVSHLLQMSVDWSPDSVKLGQQRQIEELLEKYDMIDFRTVQTPMEESLDLPHMPNIITVLPYAALLGALLWFARTTRPDIYYSVIYLSRYTNSYGPEHYAALKRVLRYLGSTKHYRLRYVRDRSWKPGDDMYMKFYDDSDWAGDKGDRKSFSGVMGFVLGGLVLWTSKKQSTVALSSCEAEYYAITEAVKLMLHAYYMLTQMFVVLCPIPLMIDNVGAGYMAQNAINNKRTKHIDIRFHFIRQHIKNKLVELFYVETKLNIADIMTKALSPEAHIRLCKLFMYTEYE